MGSIEICGLTKYYNKLCAVNGLDLSIGNEVFGLLGPNGSGKSTTVMMLTTLLRPTRGTARICGCDILKDSKKVREHISYVPQDMALDLKYSGRENVSLFARLYGISDVRSNVSRVLEIMGLSDRADSWVNTYSGGMRRRLELAQALVHKPDVLFLDEPTIGLDVAARKQIWEYIYTLREDGMTVFVTTHYMDEADQYCDRVAIIDKGTIVTVGTPESLKAAIGRDTIVVKGAGCRGEVAVSGVSLVERSDEALTFMADNGGEVLSELSERLTEAGMVIDSINVRKPSLDDVFLSSVSEAEEPGQFDDYRYRMLLRRRK
jgi:ABC-2 type transport system ATP-binding protein